MAPKLVLVAVTMLVLIGLAVALYYLSPPPPFEWGEVRG